MSDQSVAFSDLNLLPPLLDALKALGYETPSPIQAECIPALLNGEDVLGMAQTGTGKTAAFALPLLARIDLKRNEPQVLVLAPTRELAIQVAEAFQAYARFMKDFHVLPIYGGQNYTLQLKQLKRGPHVIVGTPGRVMDHLQRKTLKLEGLNALVLDEADEMLRMGFIDDVETIMAATPESRQTALFSATMPAQIKKMTTRYMREPKVIKIAAKTSTVENIEQMCWKVNQVRKIDALSRILETEIYDGVIIFARTKTATVELAERLEARGHAAAALNGDMSQDLRERTVNRLKKGTLDILVATDVAARGLDVDRIDLVVNYDIPYDTEAYVHRIGRTGRAGRKGKAILFVSHRERHLLRAIEKATKQPITEMHLPSTEAVTEKRISAFRDTLAKVFADEPLPFYQDLIEQFSIDMNMDPSQLAAALLYLAQKDKPLQPPPEEPAPRREDSKNPRAKRSRDRDNGPSSKPEGARKKRESRTPDDVESWDLFRIAVGTADGVEPKNIVGAIANEADLNSRYIGHIDMHEDHCTVELPAGMPKQLLSHLKRVRICGKQTDMTQITADKAQKPAAKASDKAPAKRKPRKRSNDS